MVGTYFSSCLRIISSSPPLASITPRRNSSTPSSRLRIRSSTSSLRFDAERDDRHASPTTSDTPTKNRKPSASAVAPFVMAAGRG